MPQKSADVATRTKNSALSARFEGPDGIDHLRDCLREQRLVEGNADVATRLADVGALCEFSPGDELLSQGDGDLDVYFILAGEVSVLVNRRLLATRVPRETVGEMAVIDPSAPRSATVRANSNVVALRVRGTDFESIADAYPRMWRLAARVIAERMRQRNRFHRGPNTTPVMFIGSSAEQRTIGEEIAQQLKFDDLSVHLWTTGVFGPSGVPVEELLTEADAADFAAFIAGPDDLVMTRKQKVGVPRDNVIFEAGVFVAKLGRERVFLVTEHDGGVKLPTDLLGITPVTYVRPDQMGPACTEIRNAIKRLGPL